MYKSCLPTSITYRNVDVLLVPHETGSQECSTVRVEQHESCGCSCKTTAENCSEIHQIWLSTAIVFSTSFSKRICNDFGIKFGGPKTMKFRENHDFWTTLVGALLW